jgi:hypothetical protein
VSRDACERWLVNIEPDRKSASGMDLTGQLGRPDPKESSMLLVRGHI